MTRRTTILAVALAMALPALAQGQADPTIPRELTLQQAVELAWEYNPTFRQTANNLGPATWAVRNAWAAFVPAVSLNGSMSYSGAGAQRILSAEFQQGSPTLGSSYGLNMSARIDGRTLMGPSLSGAQYEATQAAITGAEVNLESAVKQQYLAILQAEAQVRLSEKQLERNEEFLRLAQARFEVGQNTMLDVRQAEVAKGQSEVTLLQARQLVIVDRLRLFQTLGIPAPDDPLAVILVDTFPITQPTWQLGELLAAAGDGNPDLLSLRAQESAAKANERAAKADWLPTLSLSAGWSGFTQEYTNPDFLIGQAENSAAGNVASCEYINDNLLNPGSPPTDCSAFNITDADRAQILESNNVFPFDFTSQPFSARISISLPLFTQFSRPLAVSQASIQTEDAQEAVRARELQVRTDVSQAYFQLLAAYEAIRIQENNQTAAQEQLRLATERYRVGSGTFFELLDAQLAAQQAEADYINAIYAYHQSIATLENAVGRPLR
ncbi:MAG: TolC family protein [Gemmatimonadota bacterium]|nr:MAG: TolC family protein [Gemmatimonadota bacterium]